MPNDDALLRLSQAAAAHPYVDIPACSTKDEMWDFTPIGRLFEALQDWHIGGPGADAEVDQFLADLKEGQKP